MHILGDNQQVRSAASDADTPNSDMDSPASGVDAPSRDGYGEREAIVRIWHASECATVGHGGKAAVREAVREAVRAVQVEADQAAQVVPEADLAAGAND